LKRQAKVFLEYFGGNWYRLVVAWQTLAIPEAWTIRLAGVRDSLLRVDINRVIITILTDGTHRPRSVKMSFTRPAYIPPHPIKPINHYGLHHPPPRQRSGPTADRNWAAEILAVSVADIAVRNGGK